MLYTNQHRLTKLRSYIEQDIKPNQVKPIRAFDRSSTITPEYVGFTFLIHNGCKLIPLTILLLDLS